MHKSFINLSNFLSLVSIYLSLLPPYLPVYLPWHLNIIYLYRSFSKSLYPLAVSSLFKSFQPMILDTRTSGNCSGWSVSLQIKVNFMSRQNLTCFQSKLLFLENIEKILSFEFLIYNQINLLSSFLGPLVISLEFDIFLLSRIEWVNTKENRIYIRVEFRQSIGMNFVSPFQPEREFKVYKSCKCSQIICSRVH